MGTPAGPGKVGLVLALQGVVLGTALFLDVVMAVALPVLTALLFLSQPRCHETEICVWKDLDVVAMERLQTAPTLRDRWLVLTEVLPGPPILLDVYEGALELGKELDLAPGPLSALLAIMRRTIAMCTETPLPDVEECYTYFSELLLRHTVHCPPVSVAMFGLSQVAHIASHVLDTVLRHTKLYAYVLTPQVCLDLTLVYVGGPENCQEREEPTILPQEEEGETPGNPNTGSLLQEVAVAELVQVIPGESKEVQTGLLCSQN